MDDIGEVKFRNIIDGKKYFLSSPNEANFVGEMYVENKKSRFGVCG